MLERLKKNPIIILLLITAAVYFFLKFMTPLLAPVLAALLFVTIFGPMLKKIQERLHIHRQIGASFLLLLAGIILGLLGWVLFSWLVGSIPQWMSNLGLVEKELFETVAGLCETIGNFIGVDAHYLEETITDKLQESFVYLRTHLVPNMLTQSLQYMKILAKTGGFLVTFVIASVLLAKDYDNIMNKLLDREDCHVVLEVMCGIIRYIATYIKAQFIIMTAIAFLSAAVLGIAGIKHGILWGILAGILDALPFIGTGVVMVPIGISQLIGGNYVRAFVCFILYAACAFMRELLEPKLIGKKVGVMPIMILISLYAGIQLFGAWGIIKGPLGFIIIYQSFLSITRRGSLFR